MALSPEWKTQIEALGYAELKGEIEREETLLGEHYQSLYDADQRLEDTERQLAEETQREEARRYLDRQASIRRLEARIEDRQRRIDRLAAEADRYQRRALDPYTSLVNKIISLEVAATLLRSIRALQGWQTRDHRSLRSYRGWQTREAPQTERLRRLIAERNKWTLATQRLTEQIKTEEARIAYKKSILPEVTLSRVSIALYLIIHEGEHIYPREEGRYYIYHRPHYRKVRQRVKYPKGKFQSVLQCDAFTDPSTGEIRRDLDPFKTLEDVMRREVADEFMEEFSLKAVKPDDLTLGEVNIVPGEEEIGKPPFKLSISRTDGETGREWKTTIQRYIMTDSEYLALTRDMKDYLEALEEMG